MRKLLALFLILCTSPAFATFGAATAWDVRTTGVDTNGGAFDSGVTSPGTDESQGSGVAITITLTGTTTGTGSPAFTATTHGPGNFVHIASGAGCTVGWYEILSQSSGTATFDHAMGSTTNTCVGVIGGSLATIANALANNVSGNALWIQSGTYAQTASLTLDPTRAQTLYTRGYGVSHGDGGTKPLITTATNSIDLFLIGSNGGIQEFNNLSMSNTATTRANGILQVNQHGTSQQLYVMNCILDGFLDGINLDNSGAHYDLAYLTVVNTEVKNSSGNNVGIVAGTGLTQIYGSYIHNGGGVGIGAAAHMAVERTIIANNSSHGINFPSTQSYVSVSNSTIANNTGSGILFDAGSACCVASGQLLLYNNVLYGNNYGVNATSSYPFGFLAGKNNAYKNTNGNVWGVGPGDITLTVNPFNNAAGGDYSLNSTAGGGALLKGAGLPGIFPGATSTGSLDIGAVQSAGGGGTTIINNFGVSN